MNKTRPAPAPQLPGGNLALSLAMKGKAGNLTHGDRRTRRNRDRSSQRRAAIREQD